MRTVCERLCTRLDVRRKHQDARIKSCSETEIARRLLCLALLLWLPTSLSGQQDVFVGSRVRVGSATMRPSAGLLLASTRDSLLVGFADRPAMPVAIAHNQVKSLQASLGGDGRRAAVIGAQIGLTAGAIVFGIEHLSSRRPPPRFRYDNGDLAFAALTGAAWGLLFGGLGGAALGQERWAVATIPSATHIALPPTEARVALQTQVRLGLFRAGAAIRLRTHEGQQIEGRYDGQADGIVRVAGDSAYRVAVANVNEIFERRPLTGTWLRRGILIGAALGIATVAASASAQEKEDCSPGFCASPWPYAVPFGLSGAVAGGAIGAIVGSHVKGWRPQKW